MATADSASLGPRYAPEDPTLPHPWRGLIDGSTGLLYYWNQETNVTKYERPAALPPPLPPGPHPAVTPKLAPIPVARTLHSNDAAQQGQQTGLQQGPQIGAQQGQQTGLQQGQQNGAQQGQQVGFQQGQQLGLHQGHQIGPRQGLQAGSQQGQQIGLQQGQQIGPLQGQQIGLQQGQIGLQQGQQIGLSSSHLQQAGASPVTSPQAESQQIQQMGLQQAQRIGFQQGQQIGFSTSYLQPAGVASVANQQVGAHSVQVQQISPHAVQGQQIGVQQGHQTGFQQGQQFGVSSSHLQQAGVSSVNNQQAGAHPVQVQQMSPHAVHSQQAPSSSVNVQQSGIDSINSHHIHTQQAVDSPINRQHKSGFDSIHPRYPALATQQGIDVSANQQQNSGFDSVWPHRINMQQNFDASIHRQLISGPMVQMGPQIVHNQQAGGPPMGFKMNHEEDQHGRSGNEFYSSIHKEGGMMMAQQPKLAAIPFARNLQGMRMDGIRPQNMVHGHDSGPNTAAGHAMPNMYGHGPGGSAFSSNIPVRPPPRIHGSSDFTNVSVVDAYRQQHEVTATGENVPAPFITFEATGFPPEILREIQHAGFSSPTPIQAQTWPIALQSRDIVAIAKTGSGKTLGYLLPAFIHLRRCRNNAQNGPTILVLAPTRELATQIQDEAIKFGRSSRFSCTCLYGGAPKGPQLREIERGADIIVATPGRLNDILEMRKINFRQISFLVIDEADRMLDMGFEPQIRKIVAEIPPNRQTLMYTATWPKEVRKIAGDLLVNPVQVNIGTVDELAANKAITQYVEVVSPMEKQRRLEQILRAQEHGSKVLIFCSTKRLCDQLARSIGRSFGAAAIHGDKSQGERDWVLNQFRSGKSPILVATDVAARGLDIKDIRIVINYDFPTGIEDYVHRIGRTGRAGATGVSYTFFSDQDWKYAADLVKVLEGANQRVPPEVRDMAARGAGFSKGRSGISRWDSGGRGGRDALNSRGGRDTLNSRGGRDGFIGRGGGRGDFFGGRGNRGRGIGGPGGPGSWGRHGRALHGRHDGLNGRGRYDGRRGGGDRSRGRSYSRSPERVRTWDYDRSRSRSSRSRSWSSRSRSRSRSYDRLERSPGRNNLPPSARPRSPYPVRSSNVHHPMAPGSATAMTPPALLGGPPGPELNSNFERPEGLSPSAGATIESGAVEPTLNPAGAL